MKRFIVCLMVVFFTAVTILPNHVSAEPKTKKSAVHKFSGGKILIKRDPLLKWILIGVGAAVLIAGAGVGYYLHDKQKDSHTTINVKQSGLMGKPGGVGFTF